VTGQILVVDDDADLRETLQMLLEDTGFSVAASANGRAALEHLRGGARPRLILLDLMMPEMNGWQFLGHLRADAALAGIPVIVMTARKAADLPREDVLYKPFGRDELLDAIGRYMPPPAHAP
jgi:chemosensory pili system protein ChpA (sensor histidine kinase/response regulator)